MACWALQVPLAGGAVWVVGGGEARAADGAALACVRTSTGG